jgi:hypothetical protein
MASNPQRASMRREAIPTESRAFFDTSQPLTRLPILRNCSPFQVCALKRVRIAVNEEQREKAAR